MINKVIKACLSALVLLIAIFPYIHSSDGSGSLDLITSVGTVGIILLLIVFLVSIAFYCQALERCLSLITPSNRKAAPRSIWYMFLLPFNFIEDFFIMINVSRSIEAEAKMNQKLSSIKDYGMITGLGWCIAQIMSLFPDLGGQIAGSLALVLWILHWRFIYKVNNMLV